MPRGPSKEVAARGRAAQENWPVLNPEGKNQYPHGDKPTEMQERWTMNVLAGKNPTAAARAAGAADPRSMAYKNRRSPMLQRVNAGRLAEARRVLVEEPEVDASTHELGLYIAVLRALEAKRSVGLTAWEEVEDEKGKKRKHKSFEVVQDADNLSRLKAVEILSMLLGLNPAIETRLTVKGLPKNAPTHVTVRLVTPEMAQLTGDALRDAWKRRQAELRDGGAVAALPEPDEDEGEDDIIDGEFSEEEPA